MNKSAASLGKISGFAWPSTTSLFCAADSKLFGLHLNKGVVVVVVVVIRLNYGFLYLVQAVKHPN